ncbi:MAG: site-specific integrase, partial [Acidimicrobiales bacterium]
MRRSITGADVQGLVRVWGQRLAPRTVRRQYGVLTAVLNFAVASDIVLRSPARGVKLPAVGVRHRRVLEPAELEALAAELEESCSSGLMVYMGAVLGMRWGECAGLRVEHFDFRDRSLTISNQRTRGWGGRMIEQPPKSEAGRRTLSLPDALMDLLAAHMARRGITAADPDAYLFVGQEGLPLEYS